jgi:hypothetical protein
VATEGASPAAAAITAGGVAAIIGCHIRRTMVYWRHALTFDPNSREVRNGSRWSGALRPVHLLMLASDSAPARGPSSQACHRRRGHSCPTMNLAGAVSPAVALRQCVTLT